MKQTSVIFHDILVTLTKEEAEYLSEKTGTIGIWNEGECIASQCCLEKILSWLPAKCDVRTTFERLLREQGRRKGVLLS